jgi:rRNA maturation endonuclease Nob1
VFKQTSFRPKKGQDFAELVKAGSAFADTFGSEVRELAQASIVAQLRDEVRKANERVSDALVELNSNRLPGAPALEVGLEPMKAILRGSEEAALTTFNSSHRSIKDAIKRAAELREVLNPTRLAEVERARKALGVAWPFLATEPDIDSELRDAATELQDILERETFFKDFSKIDQNATAIETEYQKRQAVAVAARVAAYEKAIEELHTTPGWMNLTPEDQKVIALPLEIGRAKGEPSASVLQVRSDAELCPIRLQKAIATVRRIIDGDRLATLDVRPYFAGGIETEEQLDAALTGIHEECARLIGAGKKVVIG